MYEHTSDAPSYSGGGSAGLPTMTTNKSLPPDRFLQACPIRYDCRNLFVYFLEMKYVPETDSVEVLLNYPEERDANYFSNDARLNDFIFNMKRFAFPYVKTLKERNSKNPSMNSTQNNALVQFYTFACTDIERTRQYGFCRSAQSGNHILCMVSYLPWYNIFINILNRISTIINDKETSSLYHLLEALYEYQLPDPGNYAQIFSHDGSEEIRFQCPDRRIVPAIHENRNLLKFFAFFDLDKIIKIFTALLLERSILIVSKDLENLTSCSLSLEYLIYPLEWLHTFVPIMPEHVGLEVFNQPMPFIYGVHTCIYEQLRPDQKSNAVILLIDEKQVLNADKDRLPEDVAHSLYKKLKYFKDSSTPADSYIYPHSSNSSNGDHVNTYSLNNSDKYSLLHTKPIQAFLDAVLMVIGDYREYLKEDLAQNEFTLDENTFFRMKNVSIASGNDSNNNKYMGNENEFYHMFRITQALEEFCRDRCDYLKAEKLNVLDPSGAHLEKDFIESLLDHYKSEVHGITKIFDKVGNSFNKIKNKAKEKILNGSGSKQSNKSKLVTHNHNFNDKSAKKNLDLKFSVISNKPNQAKTPISIKFHDIDNDFKNSSTKEAEYELSSSSSSSISSNDQNIKDLANRIIAQSASSISEQNKNVELIDFADSFNSTTTTPLSNINQQQQNQSDSSSYLVDLFSNSNIISTSPTSQLSQISLNTDLSNDPDIRKYFENSSSSSSTTSTTNYNTDVKQTSIINDDIINDLKLIDISSSNSNQTQSQTVAPKSSLLPPPPKSSSNPTSISTNPFIKADYSSSSTTTSQSNTNRSVRDIADNYNNLFFNDFLNSNNNIKPNEKVDNSILNPAKTIKSNSIQSIISEFDPISDRNKNSLTQMPAIKTSTSLNNTNNSVPNYTNLMPRPFQSPVLTKPNYMPGSMSAQPLNTMQSRQIGPNSINTYVRSNNTITSSQSQNRMNPFAPVPFYNTTAAYPNHQAQYRPVVFNQYSKPNTSTNNNLKDNQDLNPFDQKNNF